jgi:hypothetical protein
MPKNTTKTAAYAAVYVAVDAKVLPSDACIKVTMQKEISNMAIIIVTRPLTREEWKSIIAIGTTRAMPGITATVNLASQSTKGEISSGGSQLA